MQHDYLKMFWYFDQTLGIKVVGMDRIHVWACVVIPFNLLCNMTTFRKKYVLTFWPHPGVEDVYTGKIFATMMRHSLYFDMQHDHILKSLTLASDPPP